MGSDGFTFDPVALGSIAVRTHGRRSPSLALQAGVRLLVQWQLASFEQRIHHSKSDEFEVALQQVCRIIGFRLEARVAA